MADKKISALTAATTPLAGTEVLPIVQSGSTVKVAVSDLTSGRAVSASSMTLTTPLTVANGGSGTATAFTAGSVVFAGASGVYSQSNTNFFWDNANGRLGIGIATPNNPLEVSATSGNTFFRVSNSNGSANIMLVPTQTAATKNSWLIGTQYNIDQTFEITASTAAGGTTFSTPLFTISTSGNITAKTASFIVATAGQGVNFSGNSTLAGKTSTTLTWYEEGTWTPTFTNCGTASASTATYTRVGRVMTVNLVFTATSLTANSSRFTLPIAAGTLATGTWTRGTVEGGFLEVQASTLCYFSSTPSSTTGTFTAIATYII